jgi:ABC-type phosphate/phosphonate transport system permease subunit
MSKNTIYIFSRDLWTKFKAVFSRMMHEKGNILVRREKTKKKPSYEGFFFKKNYFFFETFLVAFFATFLVTFFATFFVAFFAAFLAIISSQEIVG